MDFKYRRCSESEAVELVQWHNRSSHAVCIDLETTGLDVFSDSIVGIVISDRTPNSAAYLPPIPALLAELSVPTLLFHNFKFDLRFMHAAGVDLRVGHEIRDTMLLHHLHDENAGYDLDSIIQERYGDDYKSQFWKAHRNFTDATEPEQLTYACKDVCYTDLLYRDLLGDLADSDVPKALIEHVHSLALALYATELQGIGVDLPYLAAIGGELKPKIVEFQGKMQEAAGAAATQVELDLWAKQIDKLWTPTGKKWTTVPRPTFNWDSHTQVGNLLYDKLLLPIQRKYDKKNREWRRTTDDDALEKIEGLHPVVGMLREYAVYQKVYSAFIEGTLERVRDGKIYPSFNVNGTVTGRISSSDPNLQQLPSKGDWAKVRGIYVPDPASCIISCDYKQLEVVIAAHFSRDPNLLRIVYEGASKHDITAHSLGIDRGIAKTLNFAMQYQCTPKKVMQLLGVSMEEATYVWNKYWETYAGEKKVIDTCKRAVDAGRSIVSPWGRQRHFPKVFEKPWHKEAAYRQAYSSLIQGTGADCTHRAFVGTAEALVTGRIGRALFEVHDEIVLSVLKKAWEEAKEIVSNAMVEAGEYVKLSVPLSVSCGEAVERWEK